MQSKPKILIISSTDPTIGPGVLSTDFYAAYKQQGYDVDLLTLYSCPSHPEFLYVKKTFQGVRGILDRYTNNFIPRLISKLRGVLGLTQYPIGNHYFFYRKEEKPPVSTYKVTRCIKKQYDIVQILFWQNMLSFATLRAINDKLKCFFYLSCVDYSPMAGGCHFIGDCERYMVGCGCCPAFRSNDPYDFTMQNVEYRKQVYKEINYVVSGNSYMFDFYENSVLLKNAIKQISFPIINLDLFKPVNKIDVRKKYEIRDDKKFIMLFGCQNITDKRKGIEYMIDSINLFMSLLSSEERIQVLAVVIGGDFDKLKMRLTSDSLGLGYIPMDKLPEIYSLADVFLCSSVNDAGPMMVNQALCCGTPVVGFEMGACIDVVKGQGTGYCARLKDCKDFANGIYDIYRMSPTEKQQMSDLCLKHAQDTYSYVAAVNRVIGAYDKYKKS